MEKLATDLMIAKVTCPLTVSVVVPTKNRGEGLIDTLEGLVLLKPQPFEIIIVDQSNHSLWNESLKSAEGISRLANWPLTVEEEGFLPQNPGKIRLIRSYRTGAGRARNLGMKSARGEIVFFIDDDSIPEADWIEAVLPQFDRSDIWGVYGRILPYKDKGRYNGVEVVRIDLEPKLYSQPVLPWYLGSGANMAFRRSFLDKIANGMDEILSIGEKFRACEDIDIGYRALKFGGKIAYAPQSIVYHNSQKTFTEQLRTEAGYGIGVGAAAYKYWKCGDKYALLILGKWIWQMGIRRFGAGLLKWRSLKVIRLSLLQLWWPLIGLKRAMGSQVDKTYWQYRA